MSSTPENLQYTKEHEWVSVDGSIYTMGITDYAQDALGDVVFVGVPSVGTVVAAEQSFTEVESTKSVSDIYAPVAGTISSVNEALANEPELLNKDPYGAGWICEITIDGAMPDLLDAAAYQALVG